LSRVDRPATTPGSASAERETHPGPVGPLQQEPEIATTTPTKERGVSAETLGRSLAVVRILLGLTFLLNGLAKLFGIHRVEIGPYLGNLINRADARFILDVEVNRNARHQVPLIGRITNDLVLPNWNLSPGA